MGNYCREGRREGERREGEAEDKERKRVRERERERERGGQDAKVAAIRLKFN